MTAEDRTADNRTDRPEAADGAADGNAPEGGGGDDGDHGWLRLLLGADREERYALLWSFLFFFSQLFAYMVLRSVREALISADGARLIPTVFTSVFVCMLLLQPVYGWLVARYRRRVFLPAVYGVVILSLLAFSEALQVDSPTLWVTTGFAIFLSTINLFVDSVFWSFMADIFVSRQAKRFYGIIAAGGTAGAMLGPLVTRAIVGDIGVSGLMIMSAACYGVCLLCLMRLIPWARRQEKARHDDGERVIGGSILAGARLVVQRPLLLALVLHMFFGVSVGTLLYNQQAVVVGSMGWSTAERTEFFATLDFATNLLTLAIQLVLTRPLMTRFGVGPMLLAPAVLLVLGMGGLAVFHTALLLAIVQVTTRGLSFSLVKPARESLFTLVDREARYKAKNFIDTVVYRGSDVCTAWGYRGLAGMGLGLPALAGVWFGVAVVWLGASAWVVRQQKGRRDPRLDAEANE